MTGPGRHLVRSHLDLIEADDTYLVSFPRSGSTWVRCLLTSLVHDRPVDPELVAMTVPDVHRDDRSRRPAAPVIVKSHSPWDDLPVRTIYLARHGVEAMASYYDRQHRLGGLPAGGDPASFLLDRTIWPCPWDDHVNGWLDGLATAPPDRSLVVRYEDLRADPCGELARMADYLGLDVGSAAIERAVASNDMVELQRIEDGAGRGSLEHVGRRQTRAADLPPDAVAEFRRRAAGALARLGYAS